MSFQNYDDEDGNDNQSSFINNDLFERKPPTISKLLEISRSSSAPPKVEEMNPFSPVLEVADDFVFDPNYAQFYEGNKNMNPRLPRPVYKNVYQGNGHNSWAEIVSSKNMRMDLHGSSSSHNMNHQHQQHETSNPQDNFHTNSQNNQMYHHEMMKNMNKQKSSVVARIQNDFPRTPSPVYQKKIGGSIFAQDNPGKNDEYNLSGVEDEGSQQDGYDENVLNKFNKLSLRDDTHKKNNHNSYQSGYQNNDTNFNNQEAIGTHQKQHYTYKQPHDRFQGNHISQPSQHHHPIQYHYDEVQPSQQHMPQIQSQHPKYVIINAPPHNSNAQFTQNGQYETIPAHFTQAVYSNSSNMQGGSFVQGTQLVEFPKQTPTLYYASSSNPGIIQYIPQQQQVQQQVNSQTMGNHPQHLIQGRPMHQQMGSSETYWNDPDQTISKNKNDALLNQSKKMNPYYNGNRANKPVRQRINQNNLSRGVPIQGLQASPSPSQPYDPDYGASPRSKVMEEFKSSKGKKFELKDIIDHIQEFSRDQHGSRFIQHKLETASDEEKEFVFGEIESDVLNLMTDVFGNYVIQKFFEYGTGEQKKRLSKVLKGNVLALTLQTYGCRVIQKALEVIDDKDKGEVASELQDYVMRCVQDQNGNHVIQKCIESIPAVMIQFIVDSFKGNIVQQAKHAYGCRVIQRMLERCSPSQKNEILNEIMENIILLVKNQYGNYVVQHILERGTQEEKSQIVTQLKGQYCNLSQNKFASNVIEKCYQHGDKEDRDKILNEILKSKSPTDPNSPIYKMMKDQYANYVIQKIVSFSTDAQRKKIIDALRPNLVFIKKLAYGKHVISCLEKYGRF